MSLNSLYKITKLFHDKLEEENISEFLGTRIFYSPIISNPTYLLIGINPGKDIFIDYYKKNGKKLCDLNEMSEGLHYDIYGGQGLPDDIKKLFINSNNYDIFSSNTVKINCYFQATKNTKLLGGKLFGSLERISSNLFNKHFLEIQSALIIDLINEIHPKYIICEGVAAFKSVIKFITINKISYRYKNTKQQFNHLNEVICNINKDYNVDIVEFPRNIGGIDSNWNDAIIKWLTQNT